MEDGLHAAHVDEGRAEELAAIAEQRNAALVVRRDAVFISSPSLDVTKDVVSAIDKKLSSVKVKPIEVTE